MAYYQIIYGKKNTLTANVRSSSTPISYYETGTGQAAYQERIVTAFMSKPTDIRIALRNDIDTAYNDTYLSIYRSEAVGSDLRSWYQDDSTFSGLAEGFSSRAGANSFITLTSATLAGLNSNDKIFIAIGWYTENVSRGFDLLVEALDQTADITLYEELVRGPGPEDPVPSLPSLPSGEYDFGAPLYITYEELVGQTTSISINGGAFVETRSIILHGDSNVIARETLGEAFVDIEYEYRFVKTLVNIVDGYVDAESYWKSDNIETALASSANMERYSKIIPRNIKTRAFYPCSAESWSLSEDISSNKATIKLKAGKINNVKGYLISD